MIFQLSLITLQNWSSKKIYIKEFDQTMIKAKYKG
jgi:hypothetical protein